MRDDLSREKMHKAIDSTLSGLQGDPWLFQRISSRASEGEIIVKKKISVGLVLAIVLLLAAVTAFAIANGFGLLDFWKNSWGDAEIPADAEKYIEHDTVVDETEHFTVCFRESSYDGKTCHVVYDVIPKSKDLFLFEGYLDEDMILRIKMKISAIPTSIIPVAELDTAEDFGEWIDRNGNTVYPFCVRYECSKCGAKSDYTNFCPNCGRNMKGKQDDD